MVGSQWEGGGSNFYIRRYRENLLEKRSAKKAKRQIFSTFAQDQQGLLYFIFKKF